MRLGLFAGADGGVTLRTLSDLLAFMLQLPTPDLPVRDCAPGACSLLPATVPPALASVVASLPSFTLLKSVRAPRPCHVIVAVHPSSVQGEYRAGERVHTPSRVAPPVGRHQLPQGSSTH